MSSLGTFQSSSNNGLRPINARSQNPTDGGVERAASDNSRISFVLVAGIGTLPVRQWPILSRKWETFFESTESYVNFFTYDYQIALDNNFSFQGLLQEGHNLLAALSQQQQNALCVANAQKHSYSTVLNSILAIVFLGALHLPLNPARLSELYTLVLRSVPHRISKQGLTRIGEESWLLADISRLFSDIELQVEILSLYESKKTRIHVGMREGKGLFGSYRNYTLSDPESSTTGAAREQHFALAGTHAELPGLQQLDGQPHHKVQEWLRFVLSNNYRQTVERRVALADKKPSPTVSLTSLSSYDAARIALSDSNYNSEQVKARSGSNDATAASSIDKQWQIIPILNGFATPRRFAKLPCFMVETPVRNKDFFSRQSILDKLDTSLLPTDNSTLLRPENISQKYVVLCGIGGIGKTSIAIEYVFSRREKFDAVFWIRADEPSKLEQDFGRIATELGLQDADEPFNPVICRELAKGWLESPKKVLDEENDIISQREATWLVVFDNADSPDLLQDYWPLSSNGSILVTSRDPLSKNSPSIATESIDVAPFEPDEAAELLRKLSCVTKDVDVSVKIAATLGGLPLAISQMAAVIRYQYLSFPEFYERYEDESDRRELQKFDAVAPRPEARGNIASIWALEQLGPQAACLLQLCAILDPDCIQERLFTGDLSGVEQQLENFPKTTFTYSAARADLIKRALITRNDEKKEFWVHRVLQDSVLAKMSPENRLQVFSFAVDAVLAAWGNTPLVQRHVISLARSRDGLFPHALALRNIFERYYRAENPGSSVRLAKLMNESGWYQHERGNSQDIKPFLTLALDICNRNPGPASEQLLADIHYGLAAAANETNDGKACLYHTEKLLSMRLEALASTGKGDIRLAIAHNEYGIALVMNGDYGKSIAAFERSIEVYKGLEDYWLAMDTNPRTNMGFTFWVTGNLDRAEQVLQSLLSDRETKFGINDRESYRTGRVYHGLGNICYDRGQFEESENWHQRALQHYQDTLGNVHHKTADLCHRVAQHCLRRGALSYARQVSLTLIDQALKVYNLRETVYLPELARTTFLKARLAMQAGDVQGATDLFKQAKEMRSRIPHAPAKPDASLREADFDQVVTFFSR
ncbi:tetratricopeptide repeat domain-protein [Diplogelasinospora grovesii]|uniref:Tetratricopeptide repeat domain-protein n=1 Tax=Diplogelasinospora grovesii TaxID=303347 RepID=A0AAN6MXC0_9PEZI|nr:tetratricopeptide repeat domain-protein [Diplogelasinospora grovesii]